MNSIRTFLQKNTQRLYISNYADRPSCLFLGVHQILTICLAKLGKCEKPEFYSAGFSHWLNEERKNLFQKLSYEQSPLFWEKICSMEELSIRPKISKNNNSIASYFRNTGELLTVSGGTGGYWLRAFSFKQQSNEYKDYRVENKAIAKSVIGVLNSALFYWFWRMISDCRHLTKSNIGQFEISLSLNSLYNLSEISDEYEKMLLLTQEVREGALTYAQYRPASVKNFGDRIDNILAQHYGFTEKELDFIINYDIKYRMGKELETYIEGSLGNESMDGKG
jgi:hypothetical protein